MDGPYRFSVCTRSVNLLNKQDLLIKRASESRTFVVDPQRRPRRDATRPAILQNDLKLEYGERHRRRAGRNVALSNFTAAKKTKSKNVRGNPRTARENSRGKG